MKIPAEGLPYVPKYSKHKEFISNILISNEKVEEKLEEKKKNTHK